MEDKVEQPGLKKGEDIVLQSDYMMLTSCWIVDEDAIIITLYTRNSVLDEWEMLEDFLVDSGEYEAIAKKIAFLNMKYGGEVVW